MRCLAVLSRAPEGAQDFPASQLLTRAPVDVALALFRTLSWWMAINHPLTLDGLQQNTRRRLAGWRNVAKTFCQILCLHALSSFQRTGCHPRLRRTGCVMGCSPPTVAASVSRRCPFQGNLPRLLPSSWSVNPIRRAGEVGVRLTGLRVRHHASSGTPSAFRLFCFRAGARQANLSSLRTESTLVKAYLAYRQEIVSRRRLFFPLLPAPALARVHRY